MLSFEVVGIDRIVILAQRRINDHFLCVCVFVERVAQLHEEHLALEGLCLVGARAYFVEQCERRVMFDRSSQSPRAASMPCISALRPKLAARPIAAPPSAAAMIGPAASLQENALRVSLLPPPRLPLVR